MDKQPKGEKEDVYGSTSDCALAQHADGKGRILSEIKLYHVKIRIILPKPQKRPMILALRHYISTFMMNLPAT